MNLTETQFRLLRSRAKARAAELGRKKLGVGGSRFECKWRWDRLMANFIYLPSEIVWDNPPDLPEEFKASRFRARPLFISGDSSGQPHRVHTVLQRSEPPCSSFRIG